MEQDLVWDDEEQAESKRAWYDQNRAQMMLGLEWANGRQRLFAYAELCGVDYQGEVLVLYFLQATVMLTGAGLKKLTDKLRRHCVWWIRESKAKPFRASQDEEYVESIQIGSPELEALSLVPGQEALAGKRKVHEPA
jgi:hypothetical protein